MGEDDRDAAVRRLREAYAEGRISHGESDERLRRALTFETYGELGPALVSLLEERTASSGRLWSRSRRTRAARS
ncbi:DUF1707 domain-containing protein [Streptosporangium sp. NPDC023963]|uniref:DUF1707 SHOCT-like domain-containing protein n=1 Tax=Streptosporangium sp. NPDC023963 TaxID=3155608 RepID=UPI003446A4FE